MIFNYCPDCGNACDKNGAKLFVCKVCNKNWFDQPTTCAMVIIVNKKGEILFGARAHNPWKGKLDLIGGFLDNGESLEEGLQREIFEEIGVELSKFEYVGSFPDTYHYKGYIYTTTVAFFKTLIKDLKIRIDKQEINYFKWVNPKNIVLNSIQGGATRKIIKKYLLQNNI